MAALTPSQIAALSGCFDCLSPGIKESFMLVLLQQIQGSLPLAPLTTSSPGGLLTATATSAANPARKRFIIQNQKNEELYVRFGSGATTSNYHVALAPHNPGSKHSEPIVVESYVGAISVAPVAGNPSYTFTEFV